MNFNHRNILFLLLSLLFILSACSEDDQPEANYQRNLDQNRETWRALTLPSYQYNFRRACFCWQDFIREVMIRYTDGQFESVVYADDLSTPSDIAYPSIEALFDIIQEAIDKDETNLTVRYHPQFGYPTLISRDPHPEAVDDEITYVVDHFKINDTLHTRAIPASNLNPITDGAELEVSNAVINLAGSTEHNFDALNLTINTSSSCSSSYFRFYVSTALMKSLPPQAQTKLVRLPLADDVCDMPQTYHVVVDLTPYRQALIKGGVTEVVLLIDSLALTYSFVL